MTNQTSVLIVDDEIQLCKLIARKFQKSNFTTYTAHNGKEAVRIFKNNSIDVVILDYMLPDITGLDVLKEIKAYQEITPVVMMTAYGNIESAVSAMKLGAADYLNKPMELEELKDVVLKACSQSQVVEDTKDSNKPKAANSFVFQSEQMTTIMTLLSQVKETDASILILGESGVGKTALAKWIHNQSGRKDKPFISINCAAIPEALLESELFGYKKGAFTGASASKIGKFAAADRGTIFLDEIGEISPNMQAKLLHVIEEKKVMPLGSNDYQDVNVRIIAATNKNILELVKERKFREDLYYRLNLMEVEVPPLRNRKEDIPLLITNQIEKLNEKYNKQMTMDSKSIEMLTNYHWPGNIRELLNALERIHILKRAGEIVPEDIAYASLQFPSEEKSEGINHHSERMEQTNFQGKLPKVLEEVEEQMIQKALEEAEGNQTKAAEMLGIARHTLIYKLKKMSRKA